VFAQLSTFVAPVPIVRVLIVVVPPLSLTTSTNPTDRPASVSRFPPMSRYAGPSGLSKACRISTGSPATPVYVSRENPPLISGYSVGPADPAASTAAGTVEAEVSEGDGVESPAAVGAVAVTPASAMIRESPITAT